MKSNLILRLLTKNISFHPSVNSTAVPRGRVYSTNPLPQPEEEHDRTIANIEMKSDEQPCDFTVKKQYTVPPELRLVLPDFMPEPDFSRRNLIAEKLERLDMLRRRQVLDVPEFYVGSVLAVSVSDEHAAKCSNRFLGICISRDDRGLRHHFTLRNIVDGFGVEVMYNLYNPLIQKIEVLKLEKRLDEELYYLRDALPEYSTIPFNMEIVPLPPGAEVPLNRIKVKLRSPPWSKRWESSNCKGLANVWEVLNEQRKDMLTKTKFEPWRKYDIVEQYKHTIPGHDQQMIYDELVEYSQRSELKMPGRKWSLLTPFNKKVTRVAVKQHN